MSNTINLNDFLSLNSEENFNRDPKHFKMDRKNLQMLLQMALEVELFTIPLYMSGMYSIEGYHQINTKQSDFYQGRKWPGSAPKFKPDENSGSNQNAFNKVFKVFIEEMLHLQIAANLCNAYGDKYKVNAHFTDNGLVNKDYSWNCYGDDKTTIPGIIDFKDLKESSLFKDVKVKLDALNEKHIKLFLAIESSEQDLQNEIHEECKCKYKHNIPFEKEQDPKALMFGSISGLYTTIIMYLLLEYKDGNRLFKDAFCNDSIQRDHFNKLPSSKKVSEYPGLQTNLLHETKDSITINKLLGMIDGILDQGEGEPLFVLIYNIIKRYKKPGTSPNEPIVHNLLSIEFDGKNAIDKYLAETKDKICSTKDPKERNRLLKLEAEILKVKQWLVANSFMIDAIASLKTVSPENQVNDEALAKNHPSFNDKGESFNDKGEKIESASKAARGGDNGKMDHHEIFEAVEKLIKDKSTQTWDIVHQKGKKWTKDDLITNEADYQINLKKYPQLATAKEIANAMNEVTTNKEKYKTLLSQATTGTLKGLLVGMEDYWARTSGQFPGPAMSGSGDRMSICWALLGQTPDLNIAPDLKITKKNGFVEEHAQDYHACQGLYMPKNDERELGENNPWIKNGELGCASPAVYHSCKGSNSCKSEGGCGYVQAYEGGANCGASSGGKAAQPLHVSVPGSNNCATTGGCAVPISALQMLPEPSQLVLVNLTNKVQMMKYKDDKGDEHVFNYEKGELVYDVAWKVYAHRYNAKFGKVPNKPETNILRLVFPPST
ncbi:ferritin-like domain-containing protein [Sphingobacterium sp. MYb382]|uniref:ferritin-like domain-containing protein n=1 Tax=Sphingobacterium sp. MYb382 TaxID=2745278 RepID=UPI0030AE2E8C